MKCIISLFEIGTSKAGIGTAEDVGRPLLAGLHYTTLAVLSVSGRLTDSKPVLP